MRVDDILLLYNFIINRKLLCNNKIINDIKENIDIDNLIFIGTSFGGTTILKSLETIETKRIYKIILLDPWISHLTE